MITSFRDWFFSFQHQEKKLSYCKRVHHNPSSKYASRCWAKRTWLHVLWEKPFPEVRTNQVESMKTCWKVPWPNNEINLSRSRTKSILPVSLLAPQICGPYLFLWCLTGCHMKILSKLNYRVRLNENMDIADSISFYFNLRKAHYLRLRLKQRFSRKV